LTDTVLGFIKESSDKNNNSTTTVTLRLSYSFINTYNCFQTRKKIYYHNCDNITSPILLKCLDSSNDHFINEPNISTCLGVDVFSRVLILHDLDSCYIEKLTKLERKFYHWICYRYPDFNNSLYNDILYTLSNYDSLLRIKDIYRGIHKINTLLNTSTPRQVEI
jgi:hypothetical protein